jgi:hypothetical protein
MSADRRFAYTNESVRLQARFAVARVARKAPGMAPQNLHPRFKSGRRLQFPKKANLLCADCASNRSEMD